jgi:hypothetical protein
VLHPPPPVVCRREVQVAPQVLRMGPNRNASQFCSPYRRPDERGRNDGSDVR